MTQPDDSTPGRTSPAPPTSDAPAARGPASATPSAPPPVLVDLAARYGLAILMVAVVAVLRIGVLQPLLGQQVPFLLFVVPIIVTAWLGGFGPGLLATALGTAAAQYVIVGSGRFWAFQSAAHAMLLALFVAEGVVVSLICHALRTVAARLRAGEEALRGSESRLSAIFNQAGTGIAQVDLTGRFVLVNDRYCQLVGRSRDELMSLRMQEITHPDDVPGNLALLAQLGHDRDAFVIEKRYLRPDGTHVWARNSVSLVRDGQGQPQYVLAVSQDITDRRLAEQRLDAVVASIDDHLACYDRQWRYTYINDRGAQALGKTPEDLLGKTIWEVFPEAIGNQYDRELRAAMERQTIIRSEHYYPPLDAWFENHFYPSPDGVTVFSANITWRKRAQRALEESERRLRMVIDHMPALIAYVDREQRYVFNNAPYGQWFDTSDGELRGRHMRDVLGDAGYEIRRPWVERALNGEMVQFEAPTHHRTLGVRQTEVTYVPDRDGDDADGPVRGFYVMVHDVTERNRAAQALRESEQRVSVALVAGRMGAWEWDIRSSRVRWSETLEQIHGMAPGSFGGTFEEYQRDMHTDDRDRVLATIGQCVRERSDYLVQYRIIRPDGQLAWLEARGKLLLDDDGEPFRMVGVCTDVTARVQADDALRASEERFRLMANSAPVLIWTADTENRGTWFNEPWLRFVGRPLEQELGFGWADNVHPDDKARCVEHCQRAFDAREPFTMEFRLRRHDGEYRWVLDSGVPTFGPAGQFTGYIGSCIDITDRRQTEEALRESEARFRLVVQNSPDLILYHELNLKYQWISDPSLAVEDYQGKDEFDLLDPEQAKRVREVKLRVLRTGVGERYETSMVPPGDDKVHYYETALEARRDAVGNIIGLVSFVRDITERKQAERDIDESRRLFTRIAEATPDVLFIYDVADGRTVYVNPGVTEAMGYTPSELQEMGGSVVTLVHPDDHGGDAGQSPPADGEVRQRERRLRHKDGTYRWYSIRTVVFSRTEDGQPKEILGLASDVTERRDSERRLVQQSQALETLNRVGMTLAAELDLERLLQSVTDAGTGLTGAAFGAFFHNVTDDSGESYTLYTLSGAPKEAFAQFPMPRNTGVFGPTFRGEGIVRSDDITQDPRYGHNAPHHGIPEGHLPVRSYLAAPVVSRFGEVFGGLFFGHPEVGVFDERAERIAAGIAAQAAIAIDNARLYQRMQRELAERRRAEEALRQSEDRLRAALEASEIGTWRVDLETQLDTRDASLNHLLGLDGEQTTLDNADFLSRIHPDDRAVAAEAWLRALREGVYDAEHRIVRADGAVRWVRDRGRVVFEDGKPRYMTGAVADITERRRIEAELHESAELNRRIIESTRDCVKVLDLDGRLLSMSPGGVEMLEIDDLRSVLGTNWIDFWKDEHDHANARGAIEAARRGEAGRLLGYCPTTKGTPKWWDVVVTPIVGADGKPERLLAVSRDVTEQRLAAHELQKAKEAAEAASRAKDDFLAALSHELRTPLTPVLMTAQALEEEPGLPPNLREDLTMIRRNVELEARLIDDLLDLTRIARGKLQLHYEAVSLHDVLQHARETCCDELLERKRLTFQLDLTDEPQWVWGDPARLAQVFWNLIKNAIKFTPDGGSITVVAREQQDGRAVVSITDTGVGIDPPLIPHIFNAFEQGGADVTRRFGGLGLGLAISRALVDLHGGTIRAESAGKDRGATFSVILPTIAPQQIDATTMLTAATSAPDSDGAPAMAGSRAVVGTGARILLVEDHESTGRVLSRLLQLAGYDVHWVNGVSLALSACAQKQYDLVISDLGLPDGHGHELMRQLRDQYGLKGIALSGYGMEQDVERSRQAGFIEHLVKPVNFAKLKTVISEFASR